MGNNKYVAGPWIGELGWELFCWQGFIRKQSKGFNEKIVICRKGHNFLYEDFATDFINFELPKGCSANMFMCQGVNQQQIIQKYRTTVPHKFFQPPFNIGFQLGKDGKMHGHPPYFYQQEYHKYTSDSLDETYDIIFHPRNKKVADERNWDKDKWDRVVEKLDGKYSIAIIGSNEAFNVDGTTDRRMIPIKDTVSLMNRTRLVVGQSSGPLHLASLSGAEHLVWSTEYNRLRYEKYWNPFQTKIHFFSKGGWTPTVNDIALKIKEILG